MGSRPESIDPRKIVGLTAVSVMEIIDGEDQAAALQVIFADSSSVVCTVWTDWTLFIDRRSDAEIPDYFWPPEKHFRQLLISTPPGGAKISSATPMIDEVGETVGVDLKIGHQMVAARSLGGEIVITTS